MRYVGKKKEEKPPDRRCGSVETCRKTRPRRVRLPLAEAGQPRSKRMAKVILKDLMKIYPNTEKKKKAKKGEEQPEKKGSLQITDEGVVAVQQFNLEIEDKEFIVLVGPSGCGKSTTLRMIAGLEDISSGELWIGDKLMNDVEPKDRDIAMVFQNYALYPHMTVRENMAFSLKLKKVPKEEIDRKVEQAAEILDITQYLERKPKALSGGQRQRVAIGRAIVRDPAVFLMDEPLSNLDAKLRNQMRAEIIKLRQRINTTFVYVTHDQTEAMSMSDKIAVLSGGVVEQYDSPEIIYSAPKTEFVARFVGASNWIDGHHMFRPEKAALQFAEHTQRFDTQVQSAQFLGSSYQLHLKYQEQSWVLPSAEKMSVGTSLPIYIEEQNIITL